MSEVGSNPFALFSRTSPTPLCIWSSPVSVGCVLHHAYPLLPPGNLRSLNDLAKQARADHIIHTGDFGFYDDTSLERIAEKSVFHFFLFFFFSRGFD